MHDAMQADLAVEGDCCLHTAFLSGFEGKPGIMNVKYLFNYGEAHSCAICFRGKEGITCFLEQLIVDAPAGIRKNYLAPSLYYSCGYGKTYCE
jgi:hypothetical protein